MNDRSNTAEAIGPNVMGDSVVAFAFSPVWGDPSQQFTHVVDVSGLE